MRLSKLQRELKLFSIPFSYSEIKQGFGKVVFEHKNTSYSVEETASETHQHKPTGVSYNFGQAGTSKGLNTSQGDCIRAFKRLMKFI